MRGSGLKPVPGHADDARVSVGIERSGTPVLRTGSMSLALVAAFGLSALGSLWLVHLDAGPVRIALSCVAMVWLVVAAQEGPQRAIGAGRLDNRPLLRVSLAMFQFATLSALYGLTVGFPGTGVMVAAVHIARSGSRIWRPTIWITAAFTAGLQLLIQLGALSIPVSLAYAHVGALMSLAIASTGITNLGLSVGVAERANRKLAEAERQFRLLVQNSSDAVTVVDSEGRFSYASPSCASVLSLEADQLIGTLLVDLVHAEDAPDCQERIRGLLSGARTDDSGMRWEVRGVGDDGPLWLEFSARGLMDDDHPGVLLSVRDVTERRAAQDELTHVAAHDHLTGLKTRREFLRQASRATSVASTKSPVALLFCDLDGFKGVNDVYGHAAGDEVLRAVASRLRRTLRPQELIGRIGGDEFAVLLPGPIDEHGARVIADRLQAAVCPAITLRGGGAVRIGMSVGQVMVTAPAVDAEPVLPHADQAMYAAKFAGRLSVT